MVDDRNIDKWDIEQFFPPIAETKCPYCSSDEVFDPLTLKDKLLHIPVIIFWSGMWPLGAKRRKIAGCRRRKCRKCGFEYSVEKGEPVLIAIGAAMVLAAVVGIIVIVCWGTPA